MKKLLIAIAAVMITAASYGQGQVVFGNKQTGVFDAPVTVKGSNPLTGPGASFSAQLYLQGAGGTLTPLTPIVTFRDNAPGATGNAALANRYWQSVNADVPLAPGAEGTFIVRAWQTSLGSYDAAINARGQSDPFTASVGGGTITPPNLVNLKAFEVTIVPEPSVIVLGVLGAAALALRRRK